MELNNNTPLPLFNYAGFNIHKLWSEVFLLINYIILKNYLILYFKSIPLDNTNVLGVNSSIYKFILRVSYIIFWNNFALLDKSLWFYKWLYITFLIPFIVICLLTDFQKKLLQVVEDYCQWGLSLNNFLIIQGLLDVSIAKR